MSQRTDRRRGVPAWIVFTVLRVLSFAVPLVLVYVLLDNIVVAAVVAAVVGLCVSVIFLSGQRRAFSGELASLRARPDKPRLPDTGEDELAEDAVVEGAPGQNASAAARPKP